MLKEKSEESVKDACSIAKENDCELISDPSGMINGTDSEQRKEEKPFGKEHTAIVKGILIIMMVIRHVLDDYYIEEYQVQSLISDGVLLDEIVRFCKICISGFAFLSAYGMTMHFKKEENRTRKFYLKSMCARLVKLESTIVFIYALAFLYRRLVVVKSIRKLYDNGNGFNPIYIVIDALGMSTYFGTPEINVTWWYLHFAILLIVTMPFLYMLYERFRYLLLPTVCLLPMAVSPLEVRAGVQSNYAMLLPAVFLGIAFAFEGWFEKIKAWNQKHKWVKLVKLIAAVLAVVLAFNIWVDVEPAFAYAFIVVIPFAVYEFIAKVPVINFILKHIGHNATNIFLIHTFIYYYWYTDEIYWFEQDWCIVAVIVIICMAVSVVIEAVKKISGYNKLVNKVLHKLEKY